MNHEDERWQLRLVKEENALMSITNIYKNKYLKKVSAQTNNAIFHLDAVLQASLDESHGLMLMNIIFIFQSIDF